LSGPNFVGIPLSFGFPFPLTGKPSFFANPETAPSPKSYPLPLWILVVVKALACFRTVATLRSIGTLSPVPLCDTPFFVDLDLVLRQRRANLSATSPREIREPATICFCRTPPSAMLILLAARLRLSYGFPRDVFSIPRRSFLVSLTLFFFLFERRPSHILNPFYSGQSLRTVFQS